MVLASESPRRRELLRRAGYVFDVVPPALPEPSSSHPAPAVARAVALAYFKARSVQADHPDRVIVGADTLVSLRGRTYGKAAGPDDARRILATFAGTRHEVITGVAVLFPPGSCRPEGRRLAAETTHVTMRPLSDEDIDRYVAGGEWEGKAGAYAIQETGDAFVEKLEGSYTNVVGMPMELLARLLGEAECCAAEDGP